MNYRRYHGYDYSRGATLFITCSLKPRQKIMATIDGDTARPTAIGDAVLRCLQIELAKTPAITMMESVIMPDHIHLMLHLRAGQSEPLRALGHFMQNFKRWSKYEARKLQGGSEFGWELNYHDRNCSTREFMDRVAKYIRNNPLKWSLMHGENPPLKVVEPLSHPRLPEDEWWAGVGNLALLDGRIAALRLSTKIAAREIPAVVERCLGSVGKFTLAGTFISPCEKALMAELVARKIHFIKMLPDPLATIYRPKEDEPVLFAEDRYLLLSRVAPESESRYNAWHGINAALEGVALRNGVSLYVHRRSPEMPLEWDFKK